jgi:hypothetical protein
MSVELKDKTITQAIEKLLNTFPESKRRGMALSVAASRS